MQSKIMKTKGQDAETLILKGIFICLELWVTPTVKSLNQIKNSYRILKNLQCRHKYYSLNIFQIESVDNLNRLKYS